MKKRRKYWYVFAVLLPRLTAVLAMAVFLSVTTPVGVGIPSSQVVVLTGLGKHHSLPSPIYVWGMMASCYRACLEFHLPY